MELFSNLPCPLLGIWLGTGIIAGLASGLFGIGGGVLMVPVLLWTFSSIPIPPERAMHVAIASSLGVIIFTALSGGWAHFRRGALLPKTVALMALGGALGALVGSWGAVHLSGTVLEILFALLLLGFGIRFIQDQPLLPGMGPQIGGKTGGKTKAIPEGGRRRILRTSGVGILTGIFSALLGVGGGSIAVTLMVSLLGMPIHQAIGTSAGLIFVNALAGVASYLSMHPSTSEIPLEIHGMVGYLYLPAVIGLALGSLPAAPLGAALAHRLHPSRLKKVFGGFLLVIGTFLLIKGIAIKP